MLTTIESPVGAMAEDCVPGGEATQTTRRRRGELTPEQQELAERHLPLARGLARPLKRAWHREAEEFDSAALMALVEAAQTFDPGRNVRFATFARFRIIGALRDLQRRLHALCYHRDMPNARTYKFVPGSEEKGLLMLTSPDEPVDRAVDAAEEVEHWFKKLPPRHAEACRAIYLEDKTQLQAAGKIGCAKSRVSCMHAEAIGMLRESPEVVEAALAIGLNVRSR